MLGSIVVEIRTTERVQLRAISEARNQPQEEPSAEYKSFIELGANGPVFVLCCPFMSRYP